MKYFRLSFFGAAALLMLSACKLASADWAQSADPMVVTPVPSDLRVQAQNPPALAWARHPQNPAAYTIEIRSGNTVVKTYTSTRNWYLPSKALPNGSYTWRVRPSTTTEWSSDRGFVISAESAIYEVPEDSDLRDLIVKRAHPRGLQAGLPLFKDWSAAMRTERSQYMTWMVNEVVRLMGTLAPVSDANWPLVTGMTMTAANAAQNSLVRQQINVTTRQMHAASLLFRLTGERRYYDEAIRRGDELAGLDPTGPTSYANQDQGTRTIAVNLMKTIDALNGDLDAARMKKWLNIVEVRTNEIYKDLASNNGRMDQYPYDSHSVTNVGFLALIATLGLGDIPSARDWFDFSFRYYIASLSPWSGSEGGFANGSAYAEYALDYSIQIWQPLAQATGVDLFKKPWSAGFLKFFMEFMPPGSKTHLFGDGQETAPEFKFMKSFASRFATPEAAWYAKNLTGNEDPLSYLQAPYPIPVSTVVTAKAPPNAMLFQSIGWSAMHSNLDDPLRTSVYFKSSPYGSFNHSHGDQNGFVLKSAGVGLLTESGWYDWYGSPLWNTWYRQTKAQNALTFDGGLGQNVDGYAEPLGRNGRITAFSTTAALDYVAGDATNAYAGALTSAVRKLWYLRSSDAVVVLDQAASKTARLFEWNFHTLAPIVVGSDGKISVTNQGRSVCIRPITTGLKFEKRVGPPPLAGTYEDHGVFFPAAKALTGDFLVLLDVGCKKPTVTYSETASSRTLKVGTQTIVIPK